MGRTDNAFESNFLSRVVKKKFVFKFWLPLVLLIAGSCISLLIAFINGFPLIYSDSGAYIDMGFGNRLASDRSMYYGLFIRHISLARFPWLVIFMQSLIVNWSIFEFLKLVFNSKRAMLTYSIVIPLISVTTAYSYTTSVLLPDLFTAISFLCFLNFLFNPTASRAWKVLMGTVLLISIGFHLSNIPIFGLLLCFVFLSNLLFKRTSNLSIYKRRTFQQLIAIILTSIVLIPTVNYSIGGKFRFHNSKHAFAIYHLIELGILKDYLNQKCVQGDEFLLCPYIDELGYNFLWNPNSPLQKTGGKKANAEDFSRIISDVYTTPAYLFEIIVSSIPFTFRQFTTFQPTVMEAQLEGSAPYGQMNWRFNQSLEAYINSAQNRNELNTSIISGIQAFIVYASILYLAFVFYRNRSDLGNQHILNISTYILFLFILISPFVCSNLSTVDARYQSRIIWLVPLIASVVLLNRNFQTKLLNNSNK